MFPILFHVGPFTLHTYGLMVALGFLAALKITQRQFPRFSLPIDRLDSTVLFLMFFGLLGARLMYFAVDDFTQLKADPLSFFRVWEGGLVFYGGVLVDLLVLLILARVYAVPFLSFTDVFAAPLFLGHALGRLGCFAAGCCYGRPTDLFWGVSFTHPATLAPRFVSLHPTQIYEFLGNGALFLAAYGLGFRRPARGILTAFYAFSYGLFRFLMEFLRGDDRGEFWHGISPSQWVSLGLIVLGGGLYLYAKKNDTR
ncbi:MAG: Prolipoprotein diacylglyceryl transferase [Elusimicrobia bacterium]|nr:Prolipoprotein diacylglyceryl transferase [Elusimicrobiota bacterium]